MSCKERIIWKETLFKRKMDLYQSSYFVIDYELFLKCPYYRKTIEILFFTFLNNVIPNKRV